MSGSDQLPFPFEARRSYAREDFVPGATNEVALALIDTWPQWPAHVSALWGPQGCGKTHLGQVWRTQSNATEILPDALTIDVVTALAPGASVLIDNADRAVGGTALFHLFNFVNQTGGWLLMTGVEAPPRWRTSVPDLHSRLTSVSGAALEAPDEPLLARVLLKLFADRQLKLPEALIDYLVPRLRRSFADAERITVLIDTLALQQKRRISVDLGKKALRLLEAERDAGSTDNEDGLV